MLLEHFYVSDAFLELFVDFKSVVMSTLSQCFENFAFCYSQQLKNIQCSTYVTCEIKHNFFSKNMCFMVLICFLIVFVYDCIFDTPTSCNIREIPLYIFDPYKLSCEILMVVYKSLIFSFLNAEKIL